MGGIIGSVLIGIFGGFAVGFIASYVVYLFYAAERDYLSRKEKFIIALISGALMAFCFAMIEAVPNSEWALAGPFVAFLIHVGSVPFLKAARGED